MPIPSFADLDDPHELMGKQVLIVEDEYHLATQLADAVRQVGAVVLGPVPSVEEALAMIAQNRVDAAMLDIRLGDENSFPVATELRERGVRLIFVTGYDDWYLPDDLAEVEVCRKPADPENLLRLLFPTKHRAD